MDNDYFKANGDGEEIPAQPQNTQDLETEDTAPVSEEDGDSPQPQWQPRDANFIPRVDAPCIPRYRYEAPRREHRNNSGRAGRFIAACLICAILGGAAGGTASYRLFSAQEMAGDASATPGISGTNQPASTRTPAPVSAADGEVLSGTQIYDIGCEQTVGVTTEVTTRNVFGQTSQYSVSGSGFIIRADGYILTNYHVIESAYLNGLAVNVFLYNGEKYIADIVNIEPDNDIAVLKIEASDLPVIKTGDSDSIRVGELVYAIGNPLGELTFTQTSGTISALNREIATEASSSSRTMLESESNAINMFQFDAAVNSGNSGGPLFNSYGEVIGVVTAKYSSSGVEGLGFAIPINDAMAIANSIIENGYVAGKAYLGVIEPSTVNEASATYFNMVVGVFVKNVEPGSGADNAGMKAGDIITKIDGEDITSVGELSSAIRGYLAGDSAVITIFRDGEYLQLDVVFGEARQANG